jgi:hypothetical protein
MADIKTKPIHEVRLGRVRGAIWQNVKDGITRYGVTFSRLYKDKDDHWKDTLSFGKEDLLLLAELARQTAVLLYRDDFTKGQPGAGEPEPRGEELTPGGTLGIEDA